MFTSYDNRKATQHSQAQFSLRTLHHRVESVISDPATLEDEISGLGHEHQEGPCYTTETGIAHWH